MVENNLSFVKENSESQNPLNMNFLENSKNFSELSKKIPKKHVLAKASRKMWNFRLIPDYFHNHGNETQPWGLAVHGPLYQGRSKSQDFVTVNLKVLEFDVIIPGKIK